MAVYSHFPTLLLGVGEDVHYLHHVLRSGGRHILPGQVEEEDVVTVQCLRVVAEPAVSNNTVPTVRMLSRLLQVDHRCDSRFVELFYDCMLFDDALAETLHGQYIGCDPVGMQPIDSIGQLGILGVVLVFTLGPTAELAQEGLLLLELCDAKAVAHSMLKL